MAGYASSSRTHSALTDTLSLLLSQVAGKWATMCVRPAYSPPSTALTGGLPTPVFKLGTMAVAVAATAAGKAAR